MEFDNAFEVPLPVEEAWKVLMDIARIAPCMPGAELTEVVDARTYKGKIGVRLGPVALSFAGTVRFTEIDEAGHRAKVAAQGSDAKGRGAANAVAAFHLEPANGGSRVLVHTNLTLSGAVAQYGRGVGIIQLTAAQIITQFANNLKAQLAQDAVPPPPLAGEGGEGAPQQAQTRGQAPSLPSPASGGGSSPHAARSEDGGGIRPPSPAQAAPAAKPISAFALFAKVLWESVKRLLSRV
jgi:carbon monoxide dehydrogenase subunit G